MTVRDAASANSRGELAPVKNTFEQPGTYGDNPDTAMTDGVRHAMLKAQHEMHGKLLSPWSVRKHLQHHHGISSSESPLSDHARKHTLAQLTQGHAMNADGDLFHGSDINAGTANFANEAPPVISSVIELTDRTVRSERGVAFFKKPVGTPITEAEYLGIKQSNTNAKQQKRMTEQAAERKLLTEKNLAHTDLLTARREARAKYPAGHPERLAAERAVRQSRKSAQYRGTSAQAHVSNSKKVADARKDPAFYVPGRDHLISGGATTSATTIGVGGSFSAKAPIPVSGRLDQISGLSSGEKSRYYAMRQAGVMHDTAMRNIHAQRSRQVAPGKVVTQLKRRRKG